MPHPPIGAPRGSRRPGLGCTSPVLGAVASIASRYTLCVSESPSLRLLIVDDDEANLRTFHRVFRTRFRLELATSAERAMELLSAGGFDAVLSDFAMPGMNGVELLRFVQSAYPRMARLLVTGHADLPDVLEASAAGIADEVIAKPWDASGVVEQVGRAIEQASRR